MIVAAISPFNFIPGLEDWIRIWPELILLAAGLLTLLADLLGTPGRKGWLAIVGLAGVIGALVATAMLWSDATTGDAFFGMVNDDPVALFANVVILFALAIALLYSPGYVERQGITHEGEYYTLLILAALGMMLMSAASNLMLLFVGLEVLSLALYILCAIVTSRRRSQEAGMKYFILSSFASAFLLYGMALTYGATGATNLTAIRAFLASHRDFALGTGFGPVLLAALGLMAVGFCFKVSAIPFQAWTPDVYVGAPTSVTAFMSVGTKVAAFVGLARVFLFALSSLRVEWEPVFWVVAVLTMVGGNLLAVTQRDVKRMLAYSSVANAGYMLIAIATHTQASLQGLLIYLATYAVMNIGAFGVVLALERNDGQGTTLDDFAGLGRRSPALAALMALFMFALAGTPATAGFIGKWYVFYAAVQGAHVELAIIGVLASLVGVYYYLRVVWAIYFTEPLPTPAPAVSGEVAPVGEPVTSTGAGGVAVAEPATAATATAVAPAVGPMTATVPTDRPQPHPATWLGLALAGVLTLALGIVPMALVNWALIAAQVLIK
jgi:NADH-quinone oxidoreductase subunit N